MNRTISISLFMVLLFFSCQNHNVEEGPCNLDTILKVFHDINSTDILVTAHRALHTKYPENSMAAIHHSIDSGLDMIEIDVRQTKDRVLILMHDKTVNRTTNGEGEVKNLTLSEIQHIRLKKNPDDTLIHSVPTLEEVLMVIKGHIMVDIDIKDAAIIDLVKLVQKTGTKNQVLFFQHHNTVLDSILSLDPSMMISPRAESTERVPVLLKKFHPPTIQVESRFVTEEVIDRVKSANCKLWINALGSSDGKAADGFIENGFLPLIEKGATIIQSDRPVLLLDFLRSKGLHW